MTITEDEGGKKAQCPGCGQVVPVPTENSARLGRRPRGSGLSSAGSRESQALEPIYLEPTRTLPRPPVSVSPGPGPALYDLPTRIEPVDPTAEPVTDLTACLAPPQAADEIGRLGPYRVLEILGSGGMGVVYKAEDPQLGRLVALKAMLPALAASPTARQRFLREAKAAASVQHDHVVTIYQVGETTLEGQRGVPWLAMAYLRGTTLDARLQRLGSTPVPVFEAMRIGREIAEGLQAVHELGFVHRDIKPGNIWLEAPLDRVKILDFGLAHDSRGEAQLTQAGAIVGSPAFMSPEQANRQAIDARSDLFSLGCVLYRMCTGELPFQGDDTLSTLLALASTTPPPARERNPELPGWFSDLIMRLLARQPAERPGSAAEVAQVLSLPTTAHDTSPKRKQP
jgi:serine/threonine protein kinase